MLFLCNCICRLFFFPTFIIVFNELERILVSSEVFFWYVMATYANAKWLGQQAEHGTLLFSFRYLSTFSLYWQCIFFPLSFLFMPMKDSIYSSLLRRTYSTRAQVAFIKILHTDSLLLAMNSAYLPSIYQLSVYFIFPASSSWSWVSW